MVFSLPCRDGVRNAHAVSSGRLAALLSLSFHWLMCRGRPTSARILDPLVSKVIRLTRGTHRTKVPRVLALSCASDGTRVSLPGAARRRLIASAAHVRQRTLLRTAGGFEV